MKIKDYIIKLQNLPEKQKKIILWVIVVILFIIMGYFWFKAAVYRLNNLDNLDLGFPELQMPSISEDNLQESNTQP